MASVLDVSRALRYPGQEFPFQAEIEIEDMEFAGDPIALKDVSIQGVVVGAGERVNIRGKVESVLKSRCVRCLEETQMPLTAEVDAVYAKEENPDDPDLYQFEASTIDLTDAVRDALIMEIPMRILCKEDCKGLCPVCGVNRNLVSCTCQEGGEVANPFSALKAIVENEEEV